MSDTTPTDRELSGLLEEYEDTWKSGEKIWELRNECFYQLCGTTGKVEREIINEELKKLNALCASVSKKCHTLHSLYAWRLYQLGIDDYDYYCYYDDYDERDGPVTGDYS